MKHLDVQELYILKGMVQDRVFYLLKKELKGQIEKSGYSEKLLQLEEHLEEAIRECRENLVKDEKKRPGRPKKVQE